MSDATLPVNQIKNVSMQVDHIIVYAKMEMVLPHVMKIQYALNI